MIQAAVRFAALALLLASCRGAELQPLTVPDPTPSAPKRQPVEPCPGPTFSAAGKIFCVNPTPLAFGAAEAACGRHGGHLAVLSTAEASADAAAHLRLELGVAGRFWLGLVEPERERWTWADGATPTYGSWGPGEPNDAGGEDCAELLLPTGTWNDLSCHAANGWICERAGAGWACTGSLVSTEHGEYCVQSSSTKEWGAAQDACQANGGALAQLETQAEAAALQRALGMRLGGDRLWLGLRDTAVEGTFLWVDGSPLGHSGFAAGEPNDAGGNEDCVEIFADSGRWNDIPCHLARPALCELGR